MFCLITCHFTTSVQQNGTPITYAHHAVYPNLWSHLVKPVWELIINTLHETNNAINLKICLIINQTILVLKVVFVWNWMSQKYISNFALPKNIKYETPTETEEIKHCKTCLKSLLSSSGKQELLNTLKIMYSTKRKTHLNIWICTHIAS